jgi:pilus assembly protein CpaD
MDARAVRTIAAAAAAVSVLAGCGYSREQLAVASRDYTAIYAEEVLAELRLSTPRAGEALSELERSGVRSFAAAYLSEGRGPVVISSPRLDGEATADRAAADARAILLAEGVDASQIIESAYGETGAAGPLLVSYRTYEARAAACPDLSQHDMAETAVNAAMPSFGCATAQNLAAMIANPSDLLGAREMDPPDAGRRIVMFTKYRNGEPTGAERSRDADGQVSDAVGN